LNIPDLKMNESDLIPYEPVLEIQALRVLVLAPHPDDEVFGCAGTIASHLRQGARVHVVVLTDGAKHGSIHVRNQECLAAAATLGYGAPEFWHEGDRSLVAHEALTTRLVHLLVSENIDLLYAPSPWEIHPDHRQAAWLALEGAKRAGSLCRIAFYEVGSPLRPNVLLDITQHLDLKQRAMACFKSQMVHQPYDEQITALNRFRTYTLPATVKAAEAFLLLAHHELDSFSAQLPNAFVSWSGAPAQEVMNAKAELVSVLVRSTDRDYLLEALDSIAVQTWPRIEVLVVAAIKDHRDLPSRCGAHDLRLIRTDENLSRSAAANIALHEAKGEFLLFLDDDDWLMPSHIRRLVNTLQHQPKVLAAYTGVVLVKNDGTPLGQTLDLPFDFARQRAGNLTPIHSVMFKSSALSKGLSFNETLDLYEDWDFWLQLAQLTSFVHLPGVSAAYRIHDSSGVHNELTKTNGGIQKIQQFWSHRPPVSQDELMHRAWAFTDLEQEISDLRAEFDRQSLQLGNLKALVAQLPVALEDVPQAILEKEAAFQAILDSRSWRLTLPLRAAAAFIRRWRYQMAPHQLIRAWRVWQREGWRSTWYRTLKHVTQKSPVNPHDYSDWLKNECSHQPSQWPALLAKQKTWSFQPLISVIMPVFNPPVDLLIEAVSSIQAQIYPHWELCIADDASTNPLVWETLLTLAAKDVRIKIERRAKNGHISKASNSALSLAEGEFLALMDNDDLLPADAFHWVVDALNQHPDANIIYSDEDKLDSEGRHFGPYFKPDWNYTLFLGHNMISHLGVYRASLVKSLGGFREGFEGSQDYDLALRCVERTLDHQIIHIPRVLYHWRAIEGSTALSVDAKPYALLAAQRALMEHRIRINMPCEVGILPSLNYQLMRPPPPLGAGVSLILLGQPSDRVDGNGWWKSAGILEIFVCNRNVHEFNACLQRAQGDFVAIIDARLQPVSENSLSRLLQFASEPRTGVAGGLVQDSKGIMISGALVLNDETIASVMMKGLPPGNAGYMGRATLAQELSAISPDCMVMRTSLYKKVGGWSTAFGIGNVGASEWAMRVRAAGFKATWVPESVWTCRNNDLGDDNQISADIVKFKDKFPKKIVDEAYHPALDAVAADFSFNRRNDINGAASVR
jgi:LmbE family N-acetylglucosaminyl deacetylase/glycosyltransferase involved in cell wall biosynthesis